MNQNIYKLIIVALMTSGIIACSSQQTIVSPNLLQDVVNNKKAIEAKQITYDDPKIRSWRWMGTYPKRWDLVVFRTQSSQTDLLAARVIGLPGEKISITDGKLFIDKKEISLPSELANADYIEILKKAESLDEMIKEDHYFLLSDVGDKKRDSRDLGVILVWDILARIVG